MSDPVFKPRLPVTDAQDGDQVVTSSGNIFEYNAEQNEWVCIGILPNPDTVTPESDGLVPPDVYRKLVLIQELIDQGFDFSNFKLDTDVDNPYFYYFYSSDDLVRFTPERCPEPKEVRLTASVTGVDEVSNGTLVFLDMEGVSDYTGLTLETPFSNYEIVSNTDNIITISPKDVNILVGDTVKVVKPEAIVTKLRVEVDKNRLYQKLVRNCCVGPKGMQGDKGDTGSEGAPAESEVFQLPTIAENGLFAWDTTVEAPIDTPLSLRIFREGNDETAIIEVLQPLDDSSQMVIINDENIVVEETNFDSFYDPETKQFRGSFSVTQGAEDISTWRFKARQRGPKGPAGVDGKMFLEVITQLLDDPSVRSVDAIVSVRRGAVDGDIVIFRNTLFDEVPVSNLSAVVGDPIADILEDQFTAVSVTIDEAKDIGFYQFSPKEYDVPPLDIPLWTPTADCVQHRRWAQYRFDWFNQTDPDYLFSILLNPKPDEQCCQEDFFYCPNVGDGPCGVQGEINPPLPPPTDCICECENPIASDLSAGGLVFDPIDLTSEAAVAQRDEDGNLTGITQDPNAIDIVGEGGSSLLIPESGIQAVQLNTVESVIDGLEHNFKQNVKLVGNGEIIVTLDYDGDPCGGNVVERQSCAFVDSNAVRSFMTLVDKTGSSVISSGGMLETKTIPVTAAFTITGASRDYNPELPAAEPGIECTVDEVGKQFDLADLELNVAVNTTNVEYCRGYRITITAISDESADTLDSSAGALFRDPVVTKKPINPPMIPPPEDPPMIPPPDNPVIDPPDPSEGPPMIEPPEPPPEPPEDSFAGDGVIITGGQLTSQTDTALVLLGQSAYGLEFTTSLFNTSGTGTNQIFASFDTDIGQIVASPRYGYQPGQYDGAQNNILFSFPNLNLSKFDAAYDINGPMGAGTYIRGFNTTSLTSIRIPNVPIRQDIWTDCVAFISEPQKLGDEFKLIFIGRLLESILYDNGDSAFFEAMSNSNVDDAILVINATYDEDPMKAINSGSIAFGRQGKVTVGYLDTALADEIYPIVRVGIEGPPTPEVPGSGLTGLEISAGSYAPGETTSFTFNFTTESSLPIDGQYWFQFPSGFTLDDATIASISEGIDGDVRVVVEDNLLKIVRLGNGSVVLPGAISIAFDNVVNPLSTGLFGIEVSTREFSGSVINGPEEEDIVLEGMVPEPEPEPEGPSASLSTVSAAPATIAANGVDGAVVTVTVLDGAGAPVEGASVVIAVSGSGNSITQPATTTNASGVVLGAFATTGAGTKIVSAVVNGTIAIVDTATVTANAGTPSDANSMVEASPTSGVSANGSDSTLITVSVYDAFMNPVSGEAVTLSSTGSNNTFTPISGSTNASGVFTASLTTTTDEVKTISADLTASIGVLSSTANVTFDPPTVPSDANSTVVITGKAASPPGTEQIVADEYDSTTIVVTALDASMNPVVGEPVTVSANPFLDIITPASGVTDGSGQFTCSLAANSPGGGSSTVSANFTGSIGVISDTDTVLKTTPELDPLSVSVALSNTSPGATGVTYTITFNTIYTPNIDWGIKVDFTPFGGGAPGSSAPTGSSVGTWTTVDGTENTTIVGDVVDIVRNSDGTQGPPNPVGNQTPDGPASHTITITNVTNGTITGLRSLSIRGMDGTGVIGVIETGLYVIS